MLQQRCWLHAILVLFMLTIPQFTLAIEDITNRKALFGVPIKIDPEEIAPNNELFLFHEDGRVELIDDTTDEAPQETTQEAITTTVKDQHEFRAKPLPPFTVEQGNERKPIDNFGDVYQQLNESIFNQAKVERADIENPYPPLPTVEFNDDPTPITESPIAKSSLNRGQVFEHVTDENLLNPEDFNSGYRPTTEIHFRRTTTQEPGLLRTTNYATTRGTSAAAFIYSQHTPPAEGRFQHFREQELLDENRGFTTTTTVLPRDYGSGHELNNEEETAPPPPAPDWAVNMMLSPDSATNGFPEPQTEEPFLVTESLRTSFMTPNNGEVIEETTRRPFSTTVATLKPKSNMDNEVPTMKMYAWEMQRGDIDIRGNNQQNMRPVVQNSFSPVSKHRPQPSSNGVLMPQEVPNDVDLPRTYEIMPRYVLPQDREREEGSGNGRSSNEIVDLPQNPPIAPPTLVSAERDRDELKKEVENELHRINQPSPTSDISLFTAPKRGGGAAPLIPISTPLTLAKFGQKDRLPSVSGTVSTNNARPVSLANAPFTSFTRPVGNSLPSIFQVNGEDYSNEVESRGENLFRTLATKPPGDHNTLIALPPSPDYRPSGHTRSPGYEPNGPPGIVIVSSPPGYYPDNVVATTPSYLPKTSTPYFTETLIPRRPKTNSNDPNREYSPRVPTTTQSSQQRSTQPIHNYQEVANTSDYVNQRVSYGSFGRTHPTSLIAYDPNVQLNNSYFTSAQDRSQHILKSPPLRLPERSSYKVPDARLKVYDAPSGVSNQMVKGGRAALFFIPSPVRLSMSKAIQLKPFQSAFPPIHTPRHLLQNAVPTIPAPLPFLSPTTRRPPFDHRTTPSRLVKFRNDQTLVSNSRGLEMHHNQLNWVPIGLAAPKRLGAVKLVPAHSMQERIEIHPIEDLDAKRSDQTCSIDPRDEFADLRLETRQVARKCFKRAVNCLLHEIVPLERRISYSEEQCINFCGHHPFCRSLVYSTTMSICDIFDSRNGTGPTRTVSYAGSRYYESTSSVALDCWKAKLNDKFFTKAPNPSVLVDSDDKDDLAHNHDQQHKDEEDQNLTDKKAAPVVVAPKDHCEVDKDVVVLKSVGFRLRNLGVPALHQNSSETECVFSCLVNLARGHVPYNCASTSFGRFDNCLIYRTGSTNTHGNGHLVAEESFTHYEKACVSNQLVDLCRGYPIIRSPQHTLLGYSKQAIQAQSLIECLELCFNDYVQSGECKSIAYYYEERKNNCILNTESRQSMPQFFISEDDEVVDYASFESCFNGKTDLRHKALKGQSPTLMKKPPRLTDRRFVPHAIVPPPGASYKKSTMVYTSTRVTRPPPQTYLMDQRDNINTNEKNLYVVDTDKQPKSQEKPPKRRNSKIPIKKFLVTSEEQPKQFGSSEMNSKSAEILGFQKELSRILHDSIHRINGRRR